MKISNLCGILSNPHFNGILRFSARFCKKPAKKSTLENGVLTTVFSGLSFYMMMELNPGSRVAPEKRRIPIRLARLSFGGAA